MRFTIILLFFSLTSILHSQNQKSSKGFIENKGQIVDQNGKPNKNVLFLLNTNGLNVQIKKNGFSYDIYEIEEKNCSTEKSKDLFLVKHNLEVQQNKRKYKFHRIDISFENSNPKVEIIKEGKSSDFDNYYNIPNVPSGITNVYKYKKIKYKNIYNNIDVDFFIPEDSTKAVEYNFIIKPHANVNDIKMKFNGAKAELVDNKIKLKVRFGELTETLPLSWLEDNSKKEYVDVNYKQIDKNTFGLQTDLKNIDKTLIIDPVPIRLWGTYYGGEGDEFSSSITTDYLNNVYISGFTYSQQNIATANTYQTSLIGRCSVFISKLDTNGVRQWGTYFSFDGNQNNSQKAILCVDSNLNVYFTGKELFDSGLGTPGTFQPKKNQSTDAFLVKLNSSGFKLWGTYFGGDGNEEPFTITKDNNDNIYIGGYTTSKNIISSSNAHQKNNNSIDNNFEGFIAKFDSNGNRVWGTFYGGIGSDAFFNLSISDDNYLYATGTTSGSLTNIATPGSHQSTTSSLQNGMVVKFDLNGNRIWGTYLSDNTDIRFANLTKNNLIVGGITFNKTSISTPNVFKTEFIKSSAWSSSYREYSLYCISFDVNTEKINWGTYLPDQLLAIEQNTNEEIYLSGYTTEINPDIPTPDGFLTTKGIYPKAFILKLNNSGNRIWGTYYGGESGESWGKLKLDNNDDIYLYGNTYGSNTGIATPNSHQSSLNSQNDTFLVKFRDCSSQTLISSNSPICPNHNLELKASGGKNYSWTGPNGFTSNEQNPIIINVNPTHGGEYFCTITGTRGGCDNTLSVKVIIEDKIAPVPNLSVLPTINGDCNTIITTIPTATDNCSGTITATTTNPLSYSLPGNHTIVWSYDDGNGNVTTQNQTVSISATTVPTATSPQSFCIQQNATLNNINITGQNIKWYDAQTGGNQLASSTLLQNNTTYYASQTINNCESERIAVTIHIYNTAPPSANSNQSFCSTQNATLSDIAITGTDVKWYTSSNSTIALPITTSLANNTIYYASQTLNGCESVNRTAVTITLINTLNATNYADYLCDDLNNGQEKIDLTTYNSTLISNLTGSTFSYYKSRTGAENKIPSEKINNEKNYELKVGSSKIYVRIENINTCFQIVELDLTLYSNPIIPIAEVTPICQGNTIKINAGNFDSYIWSTQETAQEITISTAGDYWVTVTQNHTGINCSTTKNFKVLNSNKANIQHISIADWTDNNNSITVILSNASVGDYEYSIDGLIYQDSNTFTHLPTGEYTVYVRDKNGCGTTEAKTYLISYPKYFTPNGDGIHDFWKINFSTNEPNLIIHIFNRFGKLLKTLNNDGQGWDGTYLGEPLPSDDYWFTVVRANGTEYKGHFSLKR